MTKFTVWILKKGIVNINQHIVITEHSMLHRLIPFGESKASELTYTREPAVVCKSVSPHSTLSTTLLYTQTRAAHPIFDC